MNRLLVLFGYPSGSAAALLAGVLPLRYWPASTLLRGHLALATLSLLVNDPQISERWGYAHEVHLDKCNRARDFDLEFWYDVQ